MSFSAWSPVIVSTTRPWTWSSGRRPPVVSPCQDSATRGSRPMFRGFLRPSAVLTRILPVTHGHPDRGRLRRPVWIDGGEVPEVRVLEFLSHGVRKLGHVFSLLVAGEQFNRKGCRLRGVGETVAASRSGTARVGVRSRRVACADGEGAVEVEALAEAGSRCPCRRSACSRDSMPSATTSTPSDLARPTIARVTRSSADPVPTRSTRGRAILTTSNGSRHSSASDERPLPNPSSAKRTPSRRSSVIVARVSSALAPATSLRDLEDQPAGVEAALEQRAGHVHAQARAGELGRGQVHADGQLPQLLRAGPPFLRLHAGGAEDDPSDAFDQPVLLRERHELGRGDRVRAVAPPAGQRLEGDRAAGAQVDDRLVVDGDLVALQGVLERLAEQAPGLRGAPHVLGVERVARRPVALGRVHGDVRVREQLLDAGGAGRRGDADAEPDGQVAAADRERVLDGADEPLRDLFGHLGRRRFRAGRRTRRPRAGQAAPRAARAREAARRRRPATRPPRRGRGRR